MLFVVSVAEKGLNAGAHAHAKHPHVFLFE
mgnify:CR=1 FL=1